MQKTERTSHTQSHKTDTSTSRRIHGASGHPQRNSISKQNNMCYLSLVLDYQRITYIQPCFMPRFSRRRARAGAPNRTPGYATFTQTPGRLRNARARQSACLAFESTAACYGPLSTHSSNYRNTPNYVMLITVPICGRAPRRVARRLCSAWLTASCQTVTMSPRSLHFPSER